MKFPILTKKIYSIRVLKIYMRLKQKKYREEEMIINLNVNNKQLIN